MTVNIRSLYDLINILKRKQNDVTADISTNAACCATNAADISTNADDISTNADDISDLEDAPATGSGTITAGEAISANDAVYVASAGTADTAAAAYKADADIATKSTEVPRLGFASAAADSAADVVIQFDGILDGFSGLIAGRTYYLSSTAGAITADATSQQSVGVAVSATELLITTPTPSRFGIGRGVFAGGRISGYQDVIDYVTIATKGNAVDFGDLGTARGYLAGLASSSRGIFGGGYTGSYVNTIDYITIATTGNAIDFGDLSVTRGDFDGLSSATRGIFGGGYVTGVGEVNTIDYITIATLGNAADFGDLDVARHSLAACSSSTRGIFAGGNPGSGPYALQATIDYVTIATLGNAADFGDLTVARSNNSACSSPTRGIFAAGTAALSDSNVIDYVTIATLGNATDFGDLTSNNIHTGGCSSLIRGLFGGGNAPSATNIIDQVTIATLGNATDFGDLTVARSATVGCSDVHGGLG